MKNTLIIAFNGGSYGTYLEWAINTLLSDQPLQLPFTAAGNSHASELGYHLLNITGFRQYLESESNFVTARLHPKTEKNHSLKKNLEYILDHVPCLILLYPDKSHEFMCVCNYMTKIWAGHFYQGGMSYINPNDIYQNYNIDPGTDLQTIPTWIQREHMSFNLFNSWRDQVEWYFPDQWQHDRAMIISTKELFDNFENTLLRIRDFWGQSYKKDVSEIISAHREMIKLQSHLGKDQLCAEIIDSAINTYRPTVDFGIIDIISQAWIQHQLRNQGYELTCQDLNDFPTNTAQLRSLIYKV
jgi:hypothetical protein